MIKIFTLFNLAGLLLFNLIFSNPVSISQDLPARMDAGTEVRVSVKVDKAQVSGFAKLQIDLPPGFTASAIETRGASFTFADGKAKFIWMALPTQPSFTISYTLGAEATTNGTFPVTARLSYIEDNERKTVDMAPTTLMVGNGSAVASTPAPVQAPAPATTMPEREESAEVSAQQPAPIVPDAVAEAAASRPIPDAPVTETPGLPAQAGPGDVSASRTVTAISSTEYLVEVTINKRLLRGFGKLQENIPAGFSSIVKSNDEAIFSMSGRMLKFVWLNLPSKNELKVSYRLLAPEGAEGNYTVTGEFGYLLNDLTQRAQVGSSSFTIATGTVAQVQPEAPAKAEPKVTEQPKPAAEPATKPVVKEAEPVRAEAPVKKAEPAANVSAGTQPKATSVPGPETGITYKVQITAAHREVGKPYFIQRHHYSGDFSIEHHEGWIKYVTGRFEEYRAARTQRQAYIDANYNFPGPFVTAYNNGDRITVQEALMIAKQQSAQ